MVGLYNYISTKKANLSIMVGLCKLKEVKGCLLSYQVILQRYSGPNGSPATSTPKVTARAYERTGCGSFKPKP